MAVPTFDAWLRLSESERVRAVDQLNGYDGEGEDLMRRIADRFSEDFGHLPSYRTWKPLNSPVAELHASVMSWMLPCIRSRSSCIAFDTTARFPSATRRTPPERRLTT